MGLRKMGNLYNWELQPISNHFSPIIDGFGKIGI